jgi:hypothetical protein
MKYKIYKDQNLLIDYMEGSVNLQLLINITIAEQSDPDFIFVKRILSDIRSARLNVSVDELNQFLGFLKSGDDNLDFKWAIVTENPHSTALSILLQQDTFFRNIVGVFSSVKAAAEFLGVKADESMIVKNL